MTHIQLIETNIPIYTASRPTPFVLISTIQDTLSEALEDNDFALATALISTGTVTRTALLAQTTNNMYEKLSTQLNEPCTICCEPLMFPLIFECCKLILCGRCACTVAAQSQTCPMCRTTLVPLNIRQIGESRIDTIHQLIETNQHMLMILPLVYAAMVTNVTPNMVYYVGHVSTIFTPCEHVCPHHEAMIFVDKSIVVAPLVSHIGQRFPNIAKLHVQCFV